MPAIEHGSAEHIIMGAHERSSRDGWEGFAIELQEEIKDLVGKLVHANVIIRELEGNKAGNIDAMKKEEYTEKKKEIPYCVEDMDLSLYDRLEWNTVISWKSPVVIGTRITVEKIVSDIVDGWSWDDIIKHCPELTEDDIRACLKWTVENDGVE